MGWRRSGCSRRTRPSIAGAGTSTTRGSVGARRSRGWRLSLCLLALAGAPPTGAFVARLALLQAGLEDSNLLVRVALAVGVVAGVGVAGACLRVFTVVWSAPGEVATGRGGARVVLAVLAAMLLGTGLLGQATMTAAQAVSAGAGLTPGSAARRAWLEGARP
jgi:NADH:ubiquinone oxidoreductase subunit 2 (subunit N)